MAGSVRSGDRAATGGFTFRVSDTLVVPLRGTLLRLRLLDGQPRPDALRPGSRLRLMAPDGERRVVTIKALSVTGGRATSGRLQATRELDVVISAADAARDRRRIAIGWIASGPVEAGGEEAA